MYACTYIHNYYGDVAYSIFVVVVLKAQKTPMCMQSKLTFDLIALVTIVHAQQDFGI